MRISANEEHRMVIIHALTEALEKTKAAKGNCYGPLSLWKLQEYVDYLNRREQDPIELFLEGKCPKCRVKLAYDVTCYCPECHEEWWGDKVLKEFYRDPDPMFSDLSVLSISPK